MQDKKADLGDTGFVAYATTVAARLEAEGKPVAEKYRQALRKLVAYCGDDDLPLAEITTSLICSFESWMAKDVTRNTSSYYLRALQAIYNRAVRERLVADHRPFAQVFTGVAKTVKRSLTTADVSRIRHLTASGKPKRQFARDVFMLSFYLRGMSFVDMAWLTRDNLRGGFLTYSRRKTSQTVCVRWLPCMEEIVQSYASQCTGDFLLPILVSADTVSWRKRYKAVARMVNRQLDRIGRQLDLPITLTTYVARHSWATAAQSQHIPLSVISHCLGHDSEKTTRIYLAAIDNAELDKANDTVIKAIE